MSKNNPPQYERIDSFINGRQLLTMKDNTMTDDERAIRELVDTWFSASQAGDLPTVLSLMTDDVVFMVPGQEPFGKEAFEAISEEMETVQIEGTSDVQEIQVLGDWAYLRNYIKMTMTLPDGSRPVRRSGYTLTLLRKESDGRWRLARDANLLTVEA
jgi:uncharacterized protein (TIGR02246 family)